MGLKPGKLENEDAIVDVLNEIFAGHATFEKAFVYWMNECPTGKNQWYAAFDNTRPVALYGLLPMDVSYKGFQMKGALCNNVGTVPEYRKRGIFVDLGRYALQDFHADIAIGIPNEAAVPGHMKVGWKRVGTLELLSGESNRLGDVPYCVLEGFQFDLPEYEPDFLVSRNAEWRKWRYSKPGVEYRQSVFGNGFVIWKEFEIKGRGIFARMGIKSRQVMETNSDAMPLIMLGGDCKIQMWQFKNSVRSRHLKSIGFLPTMEREMIVYPGHFNLPVDNIRFDACDFDTF